MVLKVASSTRLPIGPTDVRAFLDRLAQLGKNPRSSGPLHSFIEKVGKVMPGQTAEFTMFVLTELGSLRVRAGIVAVWPHVVPLVHQLSAKSLVDAIWAASATAKPPREMVKEVVYFGLALAPRMREWSPDEAPLNLYRCTYGLAKMSAGGPEVDVFRKKAEKYLVTFLDRGGPCVWNPAQLVRLLWALGRVGSRRADLFQRFDTHLWPAIPDLSDKELEALERLLMDLKLGKMDALLEAVDRAIESREASKSGDRDQASRTNSFKNKWTRVSPMTHSASAGPGNRRKVLRRRVVPKAEAPEPDTPWP